eukprot:569223-Alexandrium_andersonii.AAC.1
MTHSVQCQLSEAFDVFCATFSSDDPWFAEHADLLAFDAGAALTCEEALDFMKDCGHVFKTAGPVVPGR